MRGGVVGWSVGGGGVVGWSVGGVWWGGGADLSFLFGGWTILVAKASFCDHSSGQTFWGLDHAGGKNKQFGSGSELGWVSS